MTGLRLLARVLAALAFAAASQAAPPPAAEPGASSPATPGREFRETIHGVEVSDPYRWMEDLSAEETKTYFRQQAEQARASLDRIPGRERLLERIRSLSEWSTRVTDVNRTGLRVFYLKLAPGLANPVLCMRDTLAGRERILIDPAQFAAGTGPGSIDWYAPSPDGRHVAFGISHGGKEDSTLRVLDVATGKEHPPVIDGARFNARLAWHPDSRSFYYVGPAPPAVGRSRYADLRIFRHVPGRATSKDEAVFGRGIGGLKDLPEFILPSLVVPEESQHALAIVREGSRPEIAVFIAEQRDLAAGRPRWSRIIGFEDEVIDLEAWKDEILMLSRKGTSSNRILGMNARSPRIARARVVVAEGEAVIQAMGLARDALYLRTMVSGIDRLERVPIGVFGAGKPVYVKTPFDTQITQLLTHPRRAGALLSLQGWTEAPAIVEVDARTGDLRDTLLQPAPLAGYSEIDDVRLYAPGHDGTRIPVTLLYRKSTLLSSDNPTLLSAFGSYGTSQRPNFDPARLAWLERGGILAIAHVRGGGEDGAAWHRGGLREKKENTVRDFIAVAEFLIRFGFTSAKHLAIEGRGAGGIPVGGALVRRPELFAAAIGRSALMDLPRHEVSASGPFDTPEFGSAATKAGFDFLRSISAYYQVRDGVRYPAALFSVGLNDPRVEAWQSAKMIARLQAAGRGSGPFLLRVDPVAGHGPEAARRQAEEELADVYAFALWRLGDPAWQPVAAAVSDPKPQSAPPTPLR